jgi:hypothetical protein
MNLLCAARGLALAILLGSLFPSEGHAAQAIPSEFNQATHQQQKRYLYQQADIALREKIVAGRRRSEEQRQFRQAIVNNMRANSEHRRAQILALTTAASAPAEREVKRSSSQRFLLPGIITVAVLAGLYWRWRSGQRPGSLS